MLTLGMATLLPFVRLYRQPKVPDDINTECNCDEKDDVLEEVMPGKEKKSNMRTLKDIS